MAAPVRADRDRTLWGPAKNLFGDLRSAGLALEGYRALRDADGPESLAAFHRAATALVRPRLAEWRARWQHGAQAAAAATGDQLDGLEEGDLSHLSGAVVRAEQPTVYGKSGMCGRLDVYQGTA